MIQADRSASRFGRFGSARSAIGLRRPSVAGTPPIRIADKCACLYRASTRGSTAHTARDLRNSCSTAELCRREGEYRCCPHESAIERSRSAVANSSSTWHNARTADNCRCTKSGSTPRQERAFGTRPPAGPGAPPEAQASVQTKQRVVAFALAAVGESSSASSRACHRGRLRSARPGRERTRARLRPSGTRPLTAEVAGRESRPAR